MAAEEPAVLTLPAKNPYQVGTLTYTKMGLATVFFWILWGDFCFSLMETVMPALLPITLKDAGASNFWINLIIGTIPGILNATVCPIVSFWSDLHRGPRGRRIPFLLWPSPFVALFLALIAYSTDIAGWLHGLVAAHTGLAISKVSVILVVVGFCVVGFEFFNMFVASVYWYLFADVVPEAFLGRFMSLFRVIGAAAGWVWNYCIFGLYDTHMKAIYIGIGGLYFAAFMMMCLRVKEGEYPPPAHETKGVGFISLVKTYFRECFRNPYYVWFFVAQTLFSMSLCTRVFLVFLYRDTLHLTLDQIGKVNAWCGIALLLLLFPGGYASDKLHPLRVSMGSFLGVLLTSLLCFFFIHDRNSMLLFLLLLAVPTAFLVVSNLPMIVALLPKDRFGQFCGAQTILNSLGLILGNTLSGLFMDWIKDYRYAFLWQAVLMFLALISMLPVYRGWRKYGGAKNYVAPI